MKKKSPSAFARKLREARKAHEIETLRSKLEALDSDKLLLISLEKIDDIIHKTARHVLSMRKGCSWKSILKAHHASLRAKVGQNKPKHPRGNQVKSSIQDRRQTHLAGGVGTDYMKPISSEYGMPEYDLE